jgi:adenylate kinase
MRAIVAGIPGAGKTTVLSLVKKLMNVEIVNFGDLMFDHAKNIVKDRDEMRKLDINTIKELQIKTAATLTKFKDKQLIIDTHFVVKTNAGFMPGLNEEMLKIIKPNLLILIKAKPEEILRRRKEDLTRKRDIETLEELEEHEKISISYLINYSTLAFCPFIIVNNEDGKQKEAAEKIVNAINKLGYEKY